MKVITLTVILVIISYSQQVRYQTYGEKISLNDNMSTELFLKEVSDEGQLFKIKGTVQEVCQSKGCWMRLKNDQNQSIRVTFKDYGFFVPKDIAGREVILEGVALQMELEEDMAKHYADDAGKAYEERITKEVSIVASGVLVRDI